MSSACLIGWSQVSRCEGEPLAAWSEALQATDVAPGAIDSLDVVYCQSWPYDDPAGRLAELVGATPARSAYSGIGGTTPLQLLIGAAERIESGQADVAAIVGGEALAQVRTIKKAGGRPDWSHRDPERKPFPFEAPFHPAEVAHQLFQAYSTFAIRDVARRAHLGLGVDEHRRALGDLFAPMTKVAAANPHAWFRREWSSAELTDVSPDNRMVAHPYTKRLMAVMDVDLSAALVIASAEAADRLGVPEGHRVHLRGWAAATDPDQVAEHDELWRSPGMAWAFEHALASAGVGVDDLDHADLYSCFPSSVLFALDALGLRTGDRLAPFTVTGGLPYAGGAGSCYLLSSVAAMADRLVGDPGSVGLVSGVGMHMTRHVAGVLSTEPGERRSAPPDPGPAVRRPIVDVHHGDATVAAYTVHHGRDGAPTDAVLICDVDGSTSGAPDGARCYAKAVDAELLAALEADEWVGRPVLLTDGGDGVNLVTRAER
ncbi:MAG: acetyl-CoA synthetase [Acidimicrobiales bacterium]